MENIQGALNALTHSADATGYRKDNPYMDYEERPDHIAQRTTYGKPTLPPQELIDVALNSYFDMVYNLHRNLSGRGKSEWVFGDEMKTIPKALQPYYNTFLRNKANVIVPKFLDTLSKAREAKAPERVIERGFLNIKNNKMKKDAWWVDINHPNYYPLSRLFDAWLRSVNAVNEAEKKKIERDIETEKNKIRDYFNDFKKKYRLVDLPEEFNPALTKEMVASAIPKNYFLTQASRHYKRPNPLPKAPPLPAPAPIAVAPVGVAKAMGGKETPAFKPKEAPKEAFPKLGKGLPIDFESMNWGSLTEQMKAYNSQHSKDLDLEGFARMIVADPKSFQKRTLQRARFYINVLLPKKK